VIKKIKKVLFISLFIIIPILFFYKIFLGYSILTGDFSGSDFLDLHLPFKFSQHESLINKTLPLWENRLSMGFPLFAEGQSGTLYPPVLLTSLLNPILGINLNLVIVFITALTSSYLFFRSEKLSKSAALFSAIAFSFSAYFITRIKHVNMLNVASLFPLLLFLANKYLQKPKIKYAIFSSVVISFMIFAGHPQIAVYNILILIIFILFKSFVQVPQEERLAKFFSSINFLTVSIVFGILLSAIQILPTLELSNLSTRSELSEAALKAYPFHPKNLVNILSPYYFGNPANGTYSLDITKYGIFWENSSYAGLITLVLAIFSIYKTISAKKRSKMSLYFIFLGIFSLLLMMGPFTPLFDFFSKNIPLFSSFRFPTRFNLYLIFSLAFLAGSGLDLVCAKFNKKKIVPFIAISILLADLFIFSNDYISFIKSDKLTKTPQFVSNFNKEKDKYFRIYSLTQYSQTPYFSYGWKNSENEILSFRESIPPNNNIIFNLDSFTDRAWFEGGLGIKERSRLENYLLKENQNPGITGKILGMFNVRYLISFSDYIGIEIDQIDSIKLSDKFSSELKLFKNNQYLPRAYFVPEAVVVDSPEAAFNQLIKPDFLPIKTVILQKQPKKIPPQFSGIIDDFVKENSVEIKKYESREVDIKANVKTHGFLVLSDINYPGWRAFVNGQEEKILPANYLVRAVELEPGENEVKFYFKSQSFQTGSYITVVTLSILLISFSVLTFSKYLARKKPQSKPN